MPSSSEARAPVEIQNATIPWSRFDDDDANSLAEPVVGDHPAKPPRHHRPVTPGPAVLPLTAGLARLISPPVTVRSSARHGCLVLPTAFAPRAELADLHADRVRRQTLVFQVLLCRADIECTSRGLEARGRPQASRPFRSSSVQPSELLSLSGLSWPLNSESLRLVRCFPAGQFGYTQNRCLMRHLQPGISGGPTVAPPSKDGREARPLRTARSAMPSSLRSFIFQPSPVHWPPYRRPDGQQHSLPVAPDVPASYGTSIRAVSATIPARVWW